MWHAEREMGIAEKLWDRHVEAKLQDIDHAHLEEAKIRVFGSPATAQERLVALIEPLKERGFEFVAAEKVAASPFFTITNARFRKNG